MLGTWEALVNTRPYCCYTILTSTVCHALLSLLGTASEEVRPNPDHFWYFSLFQPALPTYLISHFLVICPHSCPGFEVQVLMVSLPQQ